MLEFFDFDRKKIFEFFSACGDLEKKISAAGGGNDEKKNFFGKIRSIFRDTPPVKKCEEFKFEGIFRI